MAEFLPKQLIIANIENLLQSFLIVSIVESENTKNVKPLYEWMVSFETKLGLIRDKNKKWALQTPDAVLT